MIILWQDREEEECFDLLSTLEYSFSGGGVISSLCREVFPREHLSTDRIVQYSVLLLQWRRSHLIPV